MAMVGAFDDDAYTCELRELIDLYENDGVPGSPSNIWPSDQSWFVYANADLWGTKVSGREDLVGRLRDDRDLESVSLPF